MSPSAPLPDALTVRSVTDYAKAAGEQAATQALADELGVPPERLLTNGRLDPRKAAGEAIRVESAQGGAYAALAGDVASILVEGGHPNWAALTSDVTAVGAAAVCVASGALAPLAPLCGAVGSLLGKAFYTLGKDIAEGLGLYHDPPPAPPKFSTIALEGAYQNTGVWFFQNCPHYMTRLLALRQITLTTCAVADRLAGLYSAVSGHPITWLQAYEKLVSFGLTLPVQAFQTLGYELRIDEERGGIVDAQGVAVSLGAYQDIRVEEWYLAHYMHGQLLQREGSLYDDPKWWSRPDTLGTLRPSLADHHYNHQTVFVFAAITSLDKYQYGASATTGLAGGNLTWIYDPEGFFFQYETGTKIAPWILSSPHGLFDQRKGPTGLTPRQFFEQQYAALPLPKPDLDHSVVDFNGTLLPTGVVTGPASTAIAPFSELPGPGQDAFASMKSLGDRFPVVNPDYVRYFATYGSPQGFSPPIFSTDGYGQVQPSSDGSPPPFWGAGDPPTHPFTASLWLNSATFLRVYYGMGYRRFIDQASDFGNAKLSYTTSLESAFARARADLRRIAKNLREGKPANFAGSFATHPHESSSALGTMVKLGLLSAAGYAGFHAYTHGLWPFGTRHGHGKGAQVKKKKK